MREREIPQRPVVRATIKKVFENHLAMAAAAGACGITGLRHLIDGQPTSAIIMASLGWASYKLAKGVYRERKIRSLEKGYKLAFESGLEDVQRSLMEAFIRATESEGRANQENGESTTEDK